jgi:hypothetical protein
MNITGNAHRVITSECSLHCVLWPLETTKPGQGLEGQPREQTPNSSAALGNLTGR